MRIVLTATILCGTLLSGVVLAQDQGALTRLEQQITGATPPQQIEPGYLGAEMDDSQENGQGIRVLRVVAGSPAEQGGLAQGDLITDVNRQPVRNLEALAGVLSQIPAGRTVSFDVLRQHPTRGAESNKVQVTLGQRPEADERPFPDFGLAGGETGLMDVVEARFGVYGFSARAAQDAQPGVAAAVLVTEIAQDSPATRGGLLSGDLIIQVGRTTIRTPGELAAAIVANGPRASTLVIVREGVTRQAELPPAPDLADAGGEGQDPRRGTLVLEPQGEADARVRQLEQRVAALEAQLRQMQQQMNGGGQ